MDQFYISDEALHFLDPSFISYSDSNVVSILLMKFFSLLAVVEFLVEKNRKTKRKTKWLIEFCSDFGSENKNAKQKRSRQNSVNKKSVNNS